MSLPNKSFSILYDINCYCFHFFVNNEGNYVSFYIQDKKGDLYTTRETSDVYRTRQSFI